jgi:coenzyme F420 hydrogenase subunit beta
VIGIFCSESFYSEGEAGRLEAFVEAKLGQPVSTVDRFDIKRGRFYARAGETLAEWKIKEMHPFVWPICLQCQDYTAEFADVAIGSVGSGASVNTLIVRSERGASLVAAGADQGLWSLTPLENPDSLTKQSDRKRTNVAALPDDQRVLLGRSSMRGNWKRRQRRA